MIRIVQWTLCCVLLGSGLALGQGYDPAPLEWASGFTSETASRSDDDRVEAFFPELAPAEFSRQSIVRPISFAASLQDGHEQIISEATAARLVSTSRCPRCQQGRKASGGEGSSSGGSGGASASDATNPTASITQYQVQNTFTPSTYGASGYGHTLGLLMVKPFETNSKFFPAWITRTTLPVLTSADPNGESPIGPPNDTDFGFNLGRQSGLGDLVFISIFNHPTEWGSWGIGPGFVAPTATRQEIGERSWKFSPTFVVVNTSIPKWQIGFLGIYNFPLDGNGTKSLLCQPLIVRQLGEGWYTGWGDDLWSFNSESGSFAMPLQLRLGKVHQACGKQFNTFVTGNYTPDSLHKGPAPEWGIKLSISLLKAN